MYAFIVISEAQLIRRDQHGDNNTLDSFIRKQAILDAHLCTYTVKSTVQINYSESK